MTTCDDLPKVAVFMLRCSRFNKTKTFPLLVSWYVVLFMSFQFKDNVLILKLPDKTIMVDNRRVGGGKIAGFAIGRIRTRSEVTQINKNINIVYRITQKKHFKC